MNYFIIENITAMWGCCQRSSEGGRDHLIWEKVGPILFIFDYDGGEFSSFCRRKKLVPLVVVECR